MQSNSLLDFETILCVCSLGMKMLIEIYFHIAIIFLFLWKITLSAKLCEVISNVLLFLLEHILFRKESADVQKLG